MNTTPQPNGPELPRAAVAALLEDTTPWLSCDECFERMDSHAEAVITDSAHVDEAMATHLRGCAACDEEARSLIDLLRT
jgi:hypothetical protein